MKRKILLLMILVIIAGSIVVTAKEFAFATLMPGTGGKELVPPGLGIVEAPSIPKPKLLPGPTEETQKSGQTLRRFILENKLPNFIKGFLGIVAASAVVVLIIGGIYFLISYGNEEQLGKAKKTIQWALIGLVIAIFSYAIVTIITRLPFPTS